MSLFKVLFKFKTKHHFGLILIALFQLSSYAGTCDNKLQVQPNAAKKKTSNSINVHSNFKETTWCMQNRFNARKKVNIDRFDGNIWLHLIMGTILIK